MRNLIYLTIVLVCMLPSGCSKFGGDKGGASRSDVVAQVGDEQITASDIEQILDHIPPQYRMRYASSQGRREIVDGLVSIKMLAWEAKKRGIDKQEAVRMKISYLTDQTLAKELENEIKKSHKVNDADIEKYYKDHPDKYSTRERIKASHILVDSEQQADDILKQLRKGGDFEALAKKHSKCPSASRGGDLGWVGEGKMDPAFEKAAFALKKGEVSGIVKSSFGYHIIRLDDRKESSARSLDQAKKSIERILQREKIQKDVEGLKESIRKAAKVSVNEEYFKKFGEAPRQDMEDQTAVPEQGAGNALVPGGMGRPVPPGEGMPGRMPVQGPSGAAAPSPAPAAPGK